MHFALVICIFDILCELPVNFHGLIRVHFLVYFSIYKRAKNHTAVHPKLGHYLLSSLAMQLGAYCRDVAIHI